MSLNYTACARSIAACIVIFVPLPHCFLNSSSSNIERNVEISGARRRALCLKRGVDSINRLFEKSMNPIASTFNKVTIILCNGMFQGRIMFCQRRLYCFGVLLPKSCRVFDIGEEKGDRARREVSHHVPL